MSYDEPEDEIEAVAALAHSVKRVADAITEPAVPCECPTGDGGRIGCLTEAMIGGVRALCQIAESINNLAEAVREVGSDTDGETLVSAIMYVSRCISSASEEVLEKFPDAPLQ